MKTDLLVRCIALCVVAILSVGNVTYTHAFFSSAAFYTTIDTTSEQGKIAFFPTGEGKHPNVGSYIEYTACEETTPLQGKCSSSLGFGFYLYSDGSMGFWGNWPTGSAADGEETADEQSSPSFLQFNGSTLEFKAKLPPYGDKFYDGFSFMRPNPKSKEVSPNTTMVQPEKLAEITIGDAIEIRAIEHITNVQVIEVTSGKIIYTSNRTITPGDVVHVQKPTNATGLYFITVNGYAEATKETLQTSRGFLIR